MVNTPKATVLSVVLTQNADMCGKRVTKQKKKNLKVKKLSPKLDTKEKICFLSKTPSTCSERNLNLECPSTHLQIILEHRKRRKIIP